MRTNIAISTLLIAIEMQFRSLSLIYFASLLPSCAWNISFALWLSTCWLAVSLLRILAHLCSLVASYDELG
jgi:hypothetical protein